MEMENFQVVFEYPEAWPESGSRRVEVHYAGDIKVSPTRAWRRASGFLGVEVTMMAVGGKPVLLLGERPVWRVPANLQLPGLDEVAHLGWIEVDAVTGEVIPLSPEQLSAMQQRAHAIATRLALPAASGV